MSAYSYLSAAALLFGALIGLGSLLFPKWAQGVVRLLPDPAPEKPGGFSEFRATYGGLLFMVHLTALVILVMVGGAAAIFAVMPVAAGWFGAGIGRLVSLLLDEKQNRAPGMIPIWIATELALALAIASPLLHLG